MASGRAAADSMTPYHWSLILLHQSEEIRIDALINHIRHQLRRLISKRVQSAAAQRGACTSDVHVVDTLLCLASGVTSEPVLYRLESLMDTRMPFGPGSELILMMPDGRPNKAPEQAPFYVPFFRLYLFAVLCTLFGLPLLMTGSNGMSAPSRRVTRR
jgi:hypothetical protein